MRGSNDFCLIFRFPSPPPSCSVYVDTLGLCDGTLGNARVMADESFSTPAFYLNDTPTKLDAANTSPSPVSSRRQSFTPGGTTKVLADLQAGILSTRNKLDDTKHQLRQSQRQVSQLTRQTEDLKEARERLRLENEGLNNVVARKERLLQEVGSIPFRLSFWRLTPSIFPAAA